MKLIIEFDGVLADVSAVGYEAYTLAARDVDWSKLEQPEFLRRLRKQGKDANLLPGARAAKVADFWGRFAYHLDTAEVLGRLMPTAGLTDSARRLHRAGECLIVTLGKNLESRRGMLESQGGERWFSVFECLSDDPRRRPVELKALAGGEKRCVVIAASDVLVRSAGAAGLFAAAIPGGFAGKLRLTQAGASILFGNLGEFAEAVVAGGGELIRAGLPGWGV